MLHNLFQRGGALQVYSNDSVLCNSCSMDDFKSRPWENAKLKAVLHFEPNLISLIRLKHYVLVIAIYDYC